MDVNSEILQLKRRNTKVVAFFFPDDNFISSFGSIPERLAQDNKLSVIYLYGTKGSSIEQKERSVYVGGGILSMVNSVDIFFVATVMDALPASGKRVLLEHGSFAVFEPNVEQPSFENLVARNSLHSRDSQRQLANDYVTHSYSCFRLFDYYLASSRYFKRFALEIARAHRLPLSSGNSALDADLYGQLKPKYPAHVIDLTVERLRIAGHTFPKQIGVIPAGYPQIDKGIVIGQNSLNTKKDTITYAPTPIDGKTDWHPYSSLLHGGENVIESLLESFPEMYIVFKPHLSETNESTKRIIKKFSSHPKFRLSLSGSSHAELYSRTAVMISDFSQTAFTFSLSYLQPVVFHSPNEHLISSSVLRDGYCTGREKVGRVVTDIESLKSAVKELPEVAQTLREQIIAYRKSFLFNIGTSEDYICDMVPIMMGASRHHSWTCFDNVAVSD